MRNFNAFLELQMPKTLVKIFIHFAVCQTEKNGLGPQADLIASAEKKEM